jgi:hypothetical protein
MQLKASWSTSHSKWSVNFLMVASRKMHGPYPLMMISIPASWAFFTTPFGRQKQIPYRRLHISLRVRLAQFTQHTPKIQHLRSAKSLSSCSPICYSVIFPILFSLWQNMTIGIHHTGSLHLVRLRQLLICHGKGFQCQVHVTHLLPLAKRRAC